MVLTRFWAKCYDIIIHESLTFSTKSSCSCNPAIHSFSTLTDTHHVALCCTEYTLVNKKESSLPLWSLEFKGKLWKSRHKKVYDNNLFLWQHRKIMGSTTKNMWWASGSNRETNPGVALGKSVQSRNVSVFVHPDCSPNCSWWEACTGNEPGAQVHRNDTNQCIYMIGVFPQNTKR